MRDNRMLLEMVSTFTLPIFLLGYCGVLFFAILYPLSIPYMLARYGKCLPWRVYFSWDLADEEK